MSQTAVWGEVETGLHGRIWRKHPASLALVSAAHPANRGQIAGLLVADVPFHEQASFEATQRVRAPTCYPRAQERLPEWRRLTALARPAPPCGAGRAPRRNSQ